MKRLLFIISAIIATAASAQECHITLHKSMGTNFIPARLRDDSNASLHIYNGKTIDIYDNEISLMKSIEADSISAEYLSSMTRERELTGAVCTEIIKDEDVTHIYETYISNFSNLTREEKIEAIIRHEGNYSSTRSTSDIIISEPEEGITLFGNRLYEYNFFGYDYLGTQYPRIGIMLDKDERVYRFGATYEFTYSEWGEYENSYQTLSDKGVLLTQYIDTDENCSACGMFYITQSLFNQDSSYEYIRPIYTPTDEERLTSSIIEGHETPITSEGETFYKELAISGIEIVTENGEVLSSITFDEEYKNIGDLSTVSGYVIKAGAEITVLKMGGNHFITFDTAKEDEEGNTYIYKHFYKTDNVSTRIEKVNAPKLIDVIPSIPDKERAFQIHVDSKNGGKVVINSIHGTLQQQEHITAGKNILDINPTGNAGTYIITQMENGTVTDSKKIIVR